METKGTNSIAFLSLACEDFWVVRSL